MTLSPYLTVRGAARAIELYTNALGAREIYRLAEPSGRVGHAELEIGGQRLMLADEYPEIGVIGPQSRGGATSALHLDVPDVDALVAQAAAAGFQVLRPATDEFWGERGAKLADPFGHVWHVSTKIEEVSPEEMQRRWDAILAQAPAAGAGEKPVPKIPPAPPGFHTVTPYLQVQRAEELLEWVKQALGASELFRTTGSAGGLHAEVEIGDSKLMIGGSPGMEHPEIPAAIYLYVHDVDAAYQRVLDAGGTGVMPPADQPYGDRNAHVRDPFGNTWYLAARLTG